MKELQPGKSRDVSVRRKVQSTTSSRAEAGATLRKRVLALFDDGYIIRETSQGLKIPEKVALEIVIAEYRAQAA